MHEYIQVYLAELTRSGNSAHTVDAYAADLRQFAEFTALPPAAIDVLKMREWMADLYAQRLSTVTIRRKLAAVRGLFRYLLREHVVDKNVARLVRTPKAPKTLPEVITAEQANRLIDDVS